jgi:phage terminase large subunit
VKRISANRQLQKMRPVIAKMYRGSGAVHNPEGKVKGTDRSNEDYYKNAKAQNWFHVARMCKITYNAVVHGLPFDPADIISISSDCPERTRLMAEMSQPVYKQDNSGKMLVDKLPDGALSPNLADALVIAFSLGGGGMQISDAALEATGGPRGGG